MSPLVSSLQRDLPQDVDLLCKDEQLLLTWFRGLSEEDQRYALRFIESLANNPPMK